MKGYLCDACQTFCETDATDKGYQVAIPLKDRYTLEKIVWKNDEDIIKIDLCGKCYGKIKRSATNAYYDICKQNGHDGVLNTRWG